MTKVRDWFLEHSLIKDFEEGLEIRGFPEEKWAFYFQVQNALLSLPRHISPNAKVAETAELVGQVVIEAGAQILPGVFIEGPAYIGRDAMVGNNALIRRGSFMSRCSIVGNHCYSTEAVFGPGAGAFHYCGISRSLLEKNSRLSAFVVTATTRPDLQPITSHIPSRFEGEMPLKRGTIIGENTFIGAHVVIAPGISIEKNCCIGPYIFVQSDVQAGKMLKVKSDVDVSENYVTVAEIPRAPSVDFSKKSNSKSD